MSAAVAPSIPAEPTPDPTPTSTEEVTALAPTPIRAFKLGNQGFGVLIYPELRPTNNPGSSVVWSGRKEPGLIYCIAYGSNKVADFKYVGNLTPGVTFFLGVNIVWGTDAWTTSTAFTYQPDSNMMATAIMYGGAHNASIEYMGVQPYDPQLESTLAEQAPDIVEQIRWELMAAGPSLFEGDLQWPKWVAAAVIAAMITQVINKLINSGYQASASQQTETPDGKKVKFQFKFKPGLLEALTAPVPPKIKKDWGAAIAEAVRKSHAKDGGVIAVK